MTRHRISLWGLSVCLLMLLLSASPAFAQKMSGDNTNIDQDGDIGVKLNNVIACERVLDGVCVVEERYLTIPTGGTDAMVSADQLYKSGPGYVRSITLYSDATATAGTIALRDGTAAGAGNILWSFDVLAADYSKPITVDLQTPFSVGLYLDFTTTADVKCMVRYR